MRGRLRAPFLFSSLTANHHHLPWVGSGSRHDIAVSFEVSGVGPRGIGHSGVGSSAIGFWLPRLTYLFSPPLSPQCSPPFSPLFQIPPQPIIRSPFEMSDLWSTGPLSLRASGMPLTANRQPLPPLAGGVSPPAMTHPSIQILGCSLAFFSVPRLFPQSYGKPRLLHLLVRIRRRGPP